MFGLFGFCGLAFACKYFACSSPHLEFISISISKFRNQVRLDKLVFKSEIPYELVPRTREWRKDATASKLSLTPPVYLPRQPWARGTNEQGSSFLNDSVDDIYSNCLATTAIYQAIIKNYWSFISLYVTFPRNLGMNNVQEEQRLLLGDTRSDHSCWLGHYVG